MEYLARIKDVLDFLLQAINLVIRLLRQLSKAIWQWLQIRVPLIKALVSRHVRNPSTVFVDLAIFILLIYVALGITGYVLIYPKKAETRLTETLAQLYPFPAVKVNDSTVWAHRFLVRLRYLNTFSAQAPSDVATKPPTDAELRTRVLDGLLEDRIILLEARKRGIRVTTEELNLAFEKQGKTDEIAPKIKQLYGMTIVEFREILAEQVLKEKVKNAVLARSKIRHILTLDQPSANEAKRQIDSGRDFAEVAKEFSQDAKTSQTGGELGFWRKGELAAQVAQTIEDAVAGLLVNQVSTPVQTQFGFHIIQVTEITEGENKPYEEWYKETLEKYAFKKYIKI